MELQSNKAVARHADSKMAVLMHFYRGASTRSFPESLFDGVNQQPMQSMLAGATVLIDRAYHRGVRFPFEPIRPDGFGNIINPFIFAHGLAFPFFADLPLVMRGSQ